MPPVAQQNPEPAAAAAAGVTPKTAFFSPLVTFVIVGIMMVEGVLVFLAARYFDHDGPRTAFTQKYVEVDLGQAGRELASGDAVGMYREVFMVKVVLVLNGNYANLDELKAMVEARKNLLKDIVSTVIIQRKSDTELRKPTILDTLRTEIKKRLNEELGVSKDGQEVVEKVIFPESKLPAKH